MEWNGLMTGVQDARRQEIGGPVTKRWMRRTSFSGKGMIGVAKIRIAALTLCLLMVVSFAAPPAAAGIAPISWEEVDVADVAAEVAVWVNDNCRDRGVYVLPAGEVRYLLVAWGEKPTGGFTVDVDLVDHAYTGGIGVSVVLEEPGPDDIVTQALTYPYQLIKLDAGLETITVNFRGASWFGDELGEPSDDDPEIILRVADPEDEPVSNPLVVWGRARVYEATFELVVEDGHDHLSEDVITVAEGGPAWAEFAVVVSLPAYSSPHGMVIGRVEDAADGSIREVRVPIRFGRRSLPFSDVSGHWAEASIRRGIGAGFIDGYEDGTFRPERTVTRAEFVKMLVASQAGEDLAVDEDVQIPFIDARDHWVADYLRWAVAHGWMPEMDLGDTFGPDETITRLEMAVMAAFAAGLDPVAEELTFTDADEIMPALAAGWVAAAVQRGLLFGYPDGTFRPNVGLKRSESVSVVWRFADIVGDTDLVPTLSFSYTFDEDAEGWTGDFTDLPVDYDEDMYELEFGYEPLPEELAEHGNALMLSGQNRSDDLFMYVKKLLTADDGIEPETTYRIAFEVEFATDAPAGAVGAGGPPGEAVWVKVGAADVEPVPMEIIEADVPFYVLNVDKGRQNEDGDNALRIGDVAKVECGEFDVYELKTLDNLTSPLEIKSDADGNLWIFVGTDSGFEGRTRLYYNRIDVHLEKVD